MTETNRLEPISAQMAEELEREDGFRPASQQDKDAPDTTESSGQGEADSSVQNDSAGSVISTGGSIALATLLSRITGFVRTWLVLTVLGGAISSAFNIANQLPNIISEFVLGAVLSAIVIPVLVRAEREDDDAGKQFTDRLFTVATVILLAATIIGTVLSPVLVSLQIGGDHVDKSLASKFGFVLIPQVLFYGLSALFTAILNTRGLFKPGAWAPVLANIIQIAALIMLIPGALGPRPGTLSTTKFFILTVLFTLGIVVQAGIQIPALRRAGVRLRWDWGIDARLKRFGGMALAIVLYVAISATGLFISNHIASSASDAGPSTYGTMWLLLQLPYGVLGATILTAIMPRLSRNAASKNTAAVVDDLSQATRLMMVALIPCIAFMTFFGPAIGYALFAYGNFGGSDAHWLGITLSASAFTLIPYSIVLTQLRVFYAREDAWTPTFIIIGITAVKALLSYAGILFFTGGALVAWLGTANGIGFIAGAIVGSVLLRRHIGSLRTTNVVRTSAITGIVSVVITAVAWTFGEFGQILYAFGKLGAIGVLMYVMIFAIITLVGIYAVLAMLKVHEVVLVTSAVRRIAARFIPSLAVPTDHADDEDDYGPSVNEITLEFAPIITPGGSVTQSPYSRTRHARPGSGPMTGQYPRIPRQSVGPVMNQAVGQVPRGSDIAGQFDRGQRISGQPDSPDVGLSQRNRSLSPHISGGAMTEPGEYRQRRGPDLIPGAVVAGGRYRLISPHGVSHGLAFWRAKDIHLDRDVALTFVDPQQTAPPPHSGDQARATGDGPQAVLSRTLRLGRINSSGIARVLDVVRGSSGGIVVSEWIPSFSLAEVAQTSPSATGAARAVTALAAATESAHRLGCPLSIDHPARIRISKDGRAFLAFPGTTTSTREDDVRGLGAVLYSLILNRWPLSPSSSTLITTADTDEEISGFVAAVPGPDGRPIEPRHARPETSFEISAVATRALQGDHGIRTAATVAHVLEQASVVNDKTETISQVGASPRPHVRAAGSTRWGGRRRGRPGLHIEDDGAQNQPTYEGHDPARTTATRLGMAGGRPRRRIGWPLFAAASVVVLLTIAMIVALILNAFTPNEKSSGSQVDKVFGRTSTPAASPGAPSTAPPGPMTIQKASLIDYGPPSSLDNSRNLQNILTGSKPGWHTDTYTGTPSFGGLKQGLGIVLTLDQARSITGGIIESPSAGVQFDIRSMSNATAPLNSTKLLFHGTITPGSTQFSFPPTNTQYVMVWLTMLTRVNGGFGAEIDKITLNG